ncbi:TonB-dependent siderophore receptor, partial [Psychrobacter pygoscelis]|uniref:TonB-dependent siderophore receptor n=1 Tax=Psychrobacter pygoscelis TaxID=2488563 RepID=UPI00103F6B05
DATQLTLQADYHQINTKYITFLPAVGTLDTQYGKIDRESFVGVPDFDKYDNERYTIGYKISHKVTPELKIEHNLRRMKVDVDMPRVFWDRAVDENNDIYSRSSQKRRDASEVTTSGLSAQYDWSVGDNFDNVSLVGIDYSDTSQETERYNGTSTNINLLNPDHSQDSISDEFTAYPYSGRQDSKQTGIYAQNQLTFNDKITALIGIRHDKVEGVETAIFEPKTSTSGDYSATTGRIGLVYLMDSGVAPYASVSQSFDVETGKDRNGNLFEPTRGEQYEIGVRYQPEGSDTLLTGALYRIDQTDVLVADPNNSAFDYFKIQLGEVRSQGVELEARTQLGDNSNLIIAYDYTDARTIKPSPLYPEEEGKRKGEVPYNTFSLWSDYRFTDFGMPNLKMGVGLRFKDNTLLLSDESEVPSYTLVDAMASYDWSNNMKLSLNIKNLFDEDSIVCVYDCNYIEPRNIVGKVTYKW